MIAMNGGGPAFPTVEHYDDGLVAGEYHGMSLRDWFAGRAPEPPRDWLIMQEELDKGRNPYNESHKPRIRARLELYAAWSWAWADAMIAARDAK